MNLSKEVCIAVIGTGTVGSCFIKQLEELSKRPSRNPNSPKLSLILVARKIKIIYDVNYKSIPYKSIDNALENSVQGPPELSNIIDYLKAAPSKVVLVDNTSSQEIADSYSTFLKNGISIVTPNKKAFSSSIQVWEDIFLTAAESGAKVYHESSVGASLPIISTLNDLVDAGDEVLRIEGVFSGTLSYLFNSFSSIKGSSEKWSTEVIKAKNLGFTEPDPRDDLSGMDVARKLTILARLAGLPVESPTCFPVQSLIPKALEEVTDGDEFLQKLPEFDYEMEKIRVAAEIENKVVRYVGTVYIKTKQVQVGVKNFDYSNPMAILKGNDNIISFYTKRYGKNPLIIQGAGAGADVTAMGIIGDLLKIIRHLS